MSTPIEQNTTDLQNILNAVNELPNAGGGTTPAEPVIRELTVSENGTYIAPDGVDGYSPVTVNVPEPDPVLQEKSITPTTSQQIVEPDNGYDGLSKVNVGAIPSSYIQPSGTKNITENGTHDVKSYASVEVNVAGSGGSGANIQTYTVCVEPVDIGDAHEEWGTVWYTRLSGTGLECVNEDFLPSEGIEVSAVANTFCIVDMSVFEKNNSGHDSICYLEYAVVPESSLVYQMYNMDASSIWMFQVEHDTAVIVTNHGS